MLSQFYMRPKSACYRTLISRARVLANRAMRHGWIVRGTACEVCGTSEGIQGHHVNYNEPYNLRWLCLRHHRIADRLVRNNVTYSRSLIAEVSIRYKESGKYCLSNDIILH